MNELSQAERTALEAIESPVPYCLLSPKEREIVEAHWLAARDYGRERERALEDVLKMCPECAENAPWHSRGCSRTQEVQSDHGSRVDGESTECDVCHGADPDCIVCTQEQIDGASDHGPGEASEATCKSCGGKVQWHPASDDFGVCSECGHADPIERVTVAGMLSEFHAALGDEPGRGGASLRFTLHREEHEELLDELSEADEDVDRTKLARELADVVYIAYGTAHAFDIDLEVALAEIHRAAMSKLDPATMIVRADGKVLKPEGFIPPDMSAALGVQEEGPRGASAIDLIAAERERQVNEEGWTPGERALRKALSGLFDAARPYLDKAAPHEQLFDGEDLCNFEALSRAVVQAETALAASPGEPEGQGDELARATSLAERYGEGIISISAALNADGLSDKGRIMRVLGVIAGLDKPQPDHGPGEPSEEIEAENERAREADIGANLPAGFVDRLRGESNG